MRERVETLAKEALRANATGNHGQALKLLHQGMALMRGHEWTPAMSLAAALLPSLDHAVWEPGQTGRTLIQATVRGDEGAPKTLSAKLVLHAAKGTSTALAELTSAGGVFTVPPSIPGGAYRLEIGLPFRKLLKFVSRQELAPAPKHLEAV